MLILYLTLCEVYGLGFNHVYKQTLQFFSFIPIIYSHPHPFNILILGVSDKKKLFEGRGFVYYGQNRLFI